MLFEELWQPLYFLHESALTHLSGCFVTLCSFSHLKALISKELDRCLSGGDNLLYPWLSCKKPPREFCDLKHHLLLLTVYGQLVVFTEARPQVPVTWANKDLLKRQWELTTPWSWEDPVWKVGSVSRQAEDAQILLCSDTTSKGASLKCSCLWASRDTLDCFLLYHL